MTAERGANSPQVLRRINAEAVLRFALTRGAFDASDVIEATGLTRSTVLGLCEDLIRIGWISKIGDARAAGQYSKGRPATRYELLTRSGHVVGVDAGQHSVTTVVADLRGTVLGRVNRDLGDDGLDPEVRLRVTAEAIDDVLHSTETSRESILATVVGVPAPTDDDGRSPAGDAGYWAHMNPGFDRALVGIGTVVVENDANLAALAEHSLGAGVGSGSFAALLSGERFGAGLIVNHVLLRGQHGGAGELRILDLIDGVGSADGLAALAREWSRADSAAGLFDPASPLGRVPTSELTAADVFAAAAVGDPAGRELVERLGDRLARVCLVLASLIDVERVVLVGAIAAAAGPVIAEAQEVLAEKFYPPVPTIVASPLGADAVVLGAVERGLAMVRRAPLGFQPVLRLPGEQPGARQPDSSRVVSEPA